MKNILIITLILTLGISFAVWKSVTSEVVSLSVSDDTFVKKYRCGDTDSRGLLFQQSDLDSVRKLGELEVLCQSAVTNNVLIRLSIPTSKELVSILSIKSASSLLELKENGLKPLIFFEASSSWNSQNFSALAAGTYNSYISDYLKNLTLSGITTNDFYGWMIIPHPNLPNWENKAITPENFVKYYNNLHTLITKNFPGSDVGVYFSASTFESAPVDWSNRDYRTLTPYLNGIPKSSITMAGLSGYPFIPAVGTPGEVITKPNEFLPKYLIDDLRPLTELKKIIIGSNTFATLYTTESEKTVYLPADIRLEILDGIVSSLKLFTSGNIETSVYIGDPQLIAYQSPDWEYLGGTPLLDFIKNLHLNNINLIYGY